MRFALLLVFLILALTASSSVLAADFSLGLECPPGTEGPPGEMVSLPVAATLTSSGIGGADGAQGWSIGIAVEGGEIADISLEGVIVSAIGPGGPFELDLGKEAGLSIVELTSAASPLPGAVAAVILSEDSKATLAPSGTATIARIIATAQRTATPSRLRLRYADGLVGSGQPVFNTVTFDGFSVYPALGECSVGLDPCLDSEPEAVMIDGPVEAAVGTAFEVRAAATGIEPGSTPTYEWTLDGPGTIAARGETAEVTGEGKGTVTVAVRLSDGVCPDAAEATLQISIYRIDINWLRGEATGDGTFDISDPVYFLEYLFISAPEPACMPAQDFNGDGVADITDPICELSYLFLDGLPPTGNYPACEWFDGCPQLANCR